MFRFITVELNVPKLLWSKELTIEKLRHYLLNLVEEQ